MLSIVGCNGTQGTLDTGLSDAPGREGLVFPDLSSADQRPDRLPTCGDDVVNAAEEKCDGADLGGQTCKSLGFADGTLSCTDGCTHSLADCTSEGFVTVAKGSFTMGSPASEPCRGSDETQHGVTLTRSFEISSVEVTQAQYQALLAYNPSKFSSCGASCPVENVSWHEAAHYANALSQQRGLGECYACTGSGATVTCQESIALAYDCPGYRLPTEAEWEYAYRGGSTSALYNGPLPQCPGADSGADKIAWYLANSSKQPHAGGLKDPNAWAIHDMAGNVWEWVNDGYQADLGPLGSSVTDPVGDPAASKRVRRGGSWGDAVVLPFVGPYATAQYLRAAARRADSPTVHNEGLGFRLARTLP